MMSTGRFLSGLTLAAMLASAVAQDDYRVRLSANVKEQLERGVEPKTYFSQCLTRMSQEKCLELLVYWGRYQVNKSYFSKTDDDQAEVLTGWRFLELGFQRLRADLDNPSDEADRQAKLALHRNLDIAISPLTVSGEDIPVFVRDAALAYYLHVWELLPEEPVAYNDFRYKFEIGEQIKELLLELGIHNAVEGAVINQALNFYQSAFQFHQLPVPEGGPQETDKTWRASVREQMRMDIVAYVQFPGEKPLRPHRLLAHTDIEEMLLLMKRMVKSGSLSNEEYDRVATNNINADRHMEIADLRRWFDLASARGDRQRQIDLVRENIAIQRDLGNYDGAQEGLEFIREQQLQIDDRFDWAKTTLDLAIYSIKTEHWANALKLIDSAKPVLMELGLFKELGEAFAFERELRNKLHLPSLSDDLPNFNKNLVMTLTKLDTIMDEPDYQKRRDGLAAALRNKMIPLSLRLGFAIKLGDTLIELRELDKAKKLLEHWLPIAKRRKGMVDEANFLYTLLEIEVDRGDLGGFYETLHRLEPVYKQLRGDDWLEEIGPYLASVFYRIQDYAKADEINEAHMRLDKETRVREPLSGDILKETPYHYKDLLLKARIQLERGRREEAQKTIQQLEDATGYVGKESSTGVKSFSSDINYLIPDLVDVIATAGRVKEGRERLTALLKDISPLSDRNLWARAAVQKARLSLELGESVEADVAQFKELIPQLKQYPDLGAVPAVEMDLFLADYYSARGNLGKANEHLQDGLALSIGLGTIDQQIVVQRKLGDISLKGGDRQAALEHFKRSIALMDAISKRIPSDLGKVGYRIERNKAIPLFVEALYEQYRQAPTARARDELVQAIFEGKARALTEMLLPGRRTSSTNADVEDIRKRIPVGAAILEYYASEATGKVFRIIMDHSNAAVDLLDVSQQELNTQVAALRRPLTGPHEFKETLFKEMAGDLTRVLLPSDWNTFGSIPYRRLFIIPTATLHQFPFSTLVDQQGQYLNDVENLEIAYLPSSSLLLRPTPRYASGRRSAVFVNPALARDHHEILENTGELRMGLQKAIQNWHRGSFAWEKRMTAQEFLDQARNLDDVFLYTHARFLPDDPVSSYIRFAKDTTGLAELTARDLLDAKVGSGLWVLAACSTGGGVVRSGDEVLGLPRALLQAGAGTVIVSLWDVGAERSFEIMARFYRNLAGGASVAGALREATTNAHKNGAIPYDWAPFIVIGPHGFKR